MNSDFELLNCDAWAALLIDGCWSRHFSKLFTIAYTCGTNVSTEYINDLSVYFVHLCILLHNYILCIFNCGKWLQYQ